MTYSVTASWNTSDVVHDIFGCHCFAGTGFATLIIQTKSRIMKCVLKIEKKGFTDSKQSTKWAMNQSNMFCCCQWVLSIITWLLRIGFRRRSAYCGTCYPPGRKRGAGFRMWPIPQEKSNRKKTGCQIMKEWKSRDLGTGEKNIFKRLIQFRSLAFV